MDKIDELEKELARHNKTIEALTDPSRSIAINIEHINTALQSGKTFKAEIGTGDDMTFALEDVSSKMNLGNAKAVIISTSAPKDKATLDEEYTDLLKSILNEKCNVIFGADFGDYRNVEILCISIHD